jgi:hypothetical protein
MLLGFVFLLCENELRLRCVVHLRSHLDSRVGTRAVVQLSSISRNGVLSSDEYSSMRGANFEFPLWAGGPSSSRPEVRYVSYSARRVKEVGLSGSRGCAMLDASKWTLRLGVGMLKSATSPGYGSPGGGIAVGLPGRSGRSLAGAGDWRSGETRAKLLRLSWSGSHS